MAIDTQDRLGTYVTVRSADGATFDAYFAAAKGLPGPAVVVVQEIFGVNANIRQIVEAFAEAGVSAIAPDIFWRQEPGVELDPGKEDDRRRATELLKGLDEALALQDCAAAVAHLRADSSCAGKVGIVGYCMGGKLAYLAACRGLADAAVSYYGVGVQSALGEAAKAKVPVLLQIAELDHLCPPDAQAAIVEAAASTGWITVLTHPGVGHAFARKGGAGFDAEAAGRADGAALDFLHAHLGA